VIIENFRPETMERFGSATTARATNPGLDLVLGHASAPARARRARYDLLIQAVGGLMSYRPADGREQGRVPVVDVLAGLFATIGILGALTSASRGVGQVSSLAALAVAARRAGQPVGGFVGAQRFRGDGQPPSSVAPYESFHASDGDAGDRDRQRPPVNRACARPRVDGLATDPRFATNTGR